ncbi:MAG: RluA family pseudouridine synthase [Planctomycetota bacterium]|jgi:23S rRNA pseudouridine1911/1915/1917 synthase
MSNESWTVDAPGRLAAEVKRRLDLSHRRAQALIDRGAVEVDGARVTDHGHPLCAGAQVRVSIDAPRRPAQESTPPGEILHEDSHIIVVHKRAGVLTVPRDAQRELPAHLREPNLEDWLRARDLARGERPRIGIVQRLDRGTSGVLVFPRTRHARESLKPAFARHDVTRRYLAIALGRPPIAEGTLRDLLVEKHGRMTIAHPTEPGAKEAITHYRVIAKSGEGRGEPVACRLELTLETGRRNQIRLSCARAGFPLLGDRTYGTASELIARPALHAAHLGFTHPHTGERMAFTVEEPEDLRAAWRGLLGEAPPEDEAP